MNDTQKPFKLDPADKAQWLQELRSGKFTQGTDALRTVFSGCAEHCCLGVYAETRGLLNKRGQVFVKAGKIERDERECFLPSRLIPQHIQDELAKMNDDGSSFQTIANWIEENL